MEPRTLLNAGDPDATFSADGITTISFPGATFVIDDMTLLPSGKILVGGYRGANGAVARLNVDGSVDTTFGNGGLFETADYGPVNSIDTGSDGKPVLSFGSRSGVDDMKIARLNVDGTALDTSFSGDGIASVGNRWSSSFVAKVFVQRDGKILAAGSFDDGGDDDVIVVRYNTDGTPDTSFDGDGIATRGLGSFDGVSAIDVDYTGNSSTNPYYGYINLGCQRSDQQDHFYAVRFLPNGAGDSAFDGDGVYSVPRLFNATNQYATAIVSQPGGKMLIGGRSSGGTGSTEDFIFARINPNATLDTTFNGTGALLKDISGGTDQVLGMSVGYAGEVLASGYVNGKMGIIALNDNGSLDTRFSGDGILITPLVANTFGAAAAIDVTLDLLSPIRRIVIAGDNGQVGRYFDVGSVISIAATDAYAAEPGTDTATFVVSRSKATSSTERIYIGIGGTATKPNSFPVNANFDYTATGMSIGNGQTSVTYVDIPANQTSVTVTVTARNDALVEGDEQAIFTVAKNDAYDVGTPASATIVIRDDEPSTPPAVTTSGFQFETAPQQATVKFSQNVQASLGYADFVLIGPGGSSPNYSFNYDSVSNIATLSFIGILPDGDYFLRVLAAGVRNPANQAMTADYTTSFFVLAGDASRNRTVGFEDLLVLAKAYGQTSKTFSGGNFDYSADGLVGFADLLALAKNYNKTLGTAPAFLTRDSTATATSTSTARRRATLGILV